MEEKEDANKEFIDPYRELLLDREVVVKTRDGAVVRGVLVGITLRDLILRDDNGNPIIFRKDNVSYVTDKKAFQKQNSQVVKEVDKHTAKNEGMIKISIEIVERVQRINFNALAEIMDRIDNSLCNLSRDDGRFEKFMELARKIENYLSDLGFDMKDSGIWWKYFTQIGKSTNESKIQYNLSVIQEEMKKINDKRLKEILESFSKSLTM